ncbi:hypothetical protein J3Q64DRAFT_1625585, partial [Phycomyces blakesleeanus]
FVEHIRTKVEYKELLYDFYDNWARSIKQAFCSNVRNEFTTRSWYNLYWGHLFVVCYTGIFPRNIKDDQDEWSLNLLAFRKMRFSSKVYYEQNDANLVRNLRRKFGSDYALVPSAWTAPTVKLYEPIISTGIIKMLKKNGFTAFYSCPVWRERELREKLRILAAQYYLKRKRMATTICNRILK